MSLTKGNLAKLLEPLSKQKQAGYRARQIFRWFYQRGVSDWNEMSDLAKVLRAWLNSSVSAEGIKEVRRQQASDGTKKLLWQLRDGKTIESVIIPSDAEDDEAGRITACISSQVGCAMGCAFCLTGEQGFDRNLSTEEIVSQVVELRKISPITNIVFMGMGEPMHNLDAVVKSCDILLDQDGMNFSKRKITVSTCGIVPGIEEFGRRMDVSLAVSLNATTDEQRSVIMPVNKKWNIASLLSACRQYPLGSHRRITFEYVLLKDFNDSLDDAARLVGLLQGIPSKINLICFNAHDSAKFQSPSDEKVKQFQKYLLDRNQTAIVRASRGAEISAACGQLRGS